jgi:outer membrane lipoprotein
MGMGCHVTKQTVCVLLISLLLGACASQIPQGIRKAPADMPTLEQVRTHPDDYQGRQVRWGGKLIQTENREDTTWLTLLDRPLYRDGEPKFTDDSDGRFIAIVPGFLDPQVYVSDRRVTVSGTLLRSETNKVGDYPYTYPVVQADVWYLWPVETEPPYGYPYPGWYAPWYYDPWYPYGFGYPYYYWR